MCRGEWGEGATIRQLSKSPPNSPAKPTVDFSLPAAAHMNRVGGASISLHLISTSQRNAANRDGDGQREREGEEERETG